jgi:hypothetical protein
MRIPELRNRIYYFALEPTTNVFGPGNGPAIALAQVRRQICSEFRKTYMRETSVGVRWGSIDHFVDAFYPTAKAEDIKAITDCPRAIYIFTRSLLLSPIGLDLLPLI